MGNGGKWLLGGLALLGAGGLILAGYESAKEDERRGFPEHGLPTKVPLDWKAAPGEPNLTREEMQRRLDKWHADERQYQKNLADLQKRF